MTLSTAQAFVKFLDDISATEHQRTVIIPARQRTVNDRLLTKFPSTSDMPFSQGLLMGSASKGTIIRPIDDVDVLAVFDNSKNAWDKYRNDSKAFIYRIRDAYDGLSIQQIGTRGQAIRVFYEGGGHVDVAPVFYRGNDVYHLPDGTGGWLLTAPLVANTWFNQKDRELGYNLKPLVRLLKAWNRTHSKRIRSFHLETVAASMFTSLGTNRRDALRVFFESAPTRLDVMDPGGQGGSLASYLTWSSRQALVESMRSTADRAKRANDAEGSGNHDEAKRLWRIVLGDPFPAG